MKYFILLFASTLSSLSMAENDGNSYVDFLHQTAKKTAAAKGPFPDAVKFMALGENESGETVVKSIWVGNDHGTNNSVAEEIKALVHFHSSKMESKPEKSDFSNEACSKLYCFIVSNDGEKIWQISLSSDNKKYRDVSSTNYGNWQNFGY